MIELLAINPLETIVGNVVWITTLIYHFAAWIFEVFLIFASGKIIDTNKYQLLIQNFYIIIGIVVLFFVSFSLLKGMVNPDDKKSGTTMVKNTIINLITSTLILALLPTFFGFLYDFQTSFITRYNVIGRFFGYGNISEPVNTNNYATWLCDMNNKEIRHGAFQIVNSVYTAFFNVNIEKCENKVIDEESLLECQKSVKDIDTFIFIPYRTETTFADAISSVENDGLFSHYIDFSNNVIKGEISFNFILSIIAGLVLIYVGVSYCFDMALRMVKLTFYQIIAPLPIFARVVPDGPLKGTFEKWIKIVVTCYLEVFVRIFIFYFIIYLCKAIISSEYLNNILLCFGPFIWLIARALLLMGFVMFMRQAPKLISEVTGIDSSNIKLGIMDKLRDGGFFATGSAVGSYVANRLSGGSRLSALGSAWKGGRDGWKNGNLKGIGQAYNAGMAYKEAKMRGANNRDIFANRLRDIVGLDTTAEQAEREIKDKARTITNNTSAAFTFKDKNGNVHTINAGEEIEVDPLVIADLEAQILANKGKIAEKNEVMTKLDEKKQWAEAQKGLKDFFDSDGEKAWKNGKFKYKTRFADQNGNIVEKELDYEEFIKLREIGTKFYNDKNEEITGKKVLDAAREYWSIHELSSADPTGTKTQLETFLGRLESEGGYSYDKFLYNEDGTPVRGKDGSIILSEKGSTFNTTIENGKRVVIHSKKVLKTITNQKGEIEYVRDSNGDYVYEEQQLKYTEAGNGEYSFSDENGVHKASVYSVLADIMDKAAKGDIAVIDAEKEKIRTQSNGSEPSLIELQGANKAMEATKKAFEEMQTGDLQTQEQRAREAAKKYHANNNKQ